MSHTCPWCEELDARLCRVVQVLADTVGELWAEIAQLKAAFDELDAFVRGSVSDLTGGTP